MIVAIDPKTIRMDDNMQSRVEMNESVVAEYAEAMERGDEFPPLSVFYDRDSEKHLLADGFHRLHAHLQVKPNDPILVDRQFGTLDDVVWASIGANKTHGLKRSNDDKRHAVRRALIHPNGEKQSNRQIAVHVGVNCKMVANIRADMETSGEIPKTDVRIGRDGRAIHTKNIHRTRKSNDATCGRCLNYDTDHGTCMLDSGVHPKTNTACPEFVPIPDEPVVLKRAPIPENYQVIDEPEPKRQPVKSCHYKPRNTLVVDVPLDNPDLAVVELRHQLGEEYLDQCFAAWRTLKTSD